MANNPYVNKVVFGSATLVDLTGTTATADKIMQGYGAFGADGAWMDGTATGGDQHGTIWQDGQGYVHLDDESGIALQSKTATPTESQQVIEADTGYYALDKVTVGAISSSYVGSGIARRSSSDLTANGATVTAPAGYYSASASKSVASGSVVPSIEYSGDDISVWVENTGLVHVEGGYSATEYPVSTSGWIDSSAFTEVEIALQNTYQLSTQAAKTVTPTTSSQTAVTAGKYTTGAVTVAAMPTGTAGTPTATKGTVSNHAVTVTPSVTNTTGYISGGTKTGTAVTVTASELVSGTKSITENGTGIDVTNYARVNVSIDASTEFLVTFSKNQNDEWVPDCTFAEALSAYNAGKTVVSKTNSDYNGAFIVYDDENDGFIYQIFEQFNEYDGSSQYYDWGTHIYAYIWTSEGVELDDDAKYYNTSLANATPSDVTSGKRFYNAQGIQIGTASSGSSYTYIGSTTYTVSTSSTTAVSVGTFNTGNTSIWTSDKMLYVKIRDTAGRRNGYYYGSDCMFANNAPGNNLSSTSNSLVHGTSYYQNSAGYLINFTLQRTNSTAATQGYGVYATYVHDDGSIDINARYNSSNTLTIDGTFKVDVYLLDWPGGVSPFNG